MMVYFELARFPLQLYRYIRIIKYWLKLLNSDNCVLKACYNDMYDRIDSDGKYNWLVQVKDLLCRHGFNDIWLQQSVSDTKYF